MFQDEKNWRWQPSPKAEQQNRTTIINPPLVLSISANRIVVLAEHFVVRSCISKSYWPVTLGTDISIIRIGHTGRETGSNAIPLG